MKEKSFNFKYRVQQKKVDP